MPVKSLMNGDYRLVMAFQSASYPTDWYRVLADCQSGQLSCDCPAWLFVKNGRRSCKHTEAAVSLVERAGGPLDEPGGPGGPGGPGAPTSDHERSLVGAVQGQWPGLQGSWQIEEHAGRVGRDIYHFVLITLATRTGITATGLAAFARRHGHSTAHLIPGVAGWIGYRLAAEVAQQSGFSLAGPPPAHFRLARSYRGKERGIGLRDILRVGDRADLGDGLIPEQRAENTLQLFLGDLYETLQTEGFLDVPSVLHGDRQRVYRLRRDPARRRERRLRVFEHGAYVKDFCVVRAAAVPEADHFLTLFLQLMADEQGVLDVVGPHNIFRPHSDGAEEETIPAIWRPRAAA